jgi:hypothetical protein
VHRVLQPKAAAEQQAMSRGCPGSMSWRFEPRPASNRRHSFLLCRRRFRSRFFFHPLHFTLGGSATHHGFDHFRASRHCAATASARFPSCGLPHGRSGVDLQMIRTSCHLPCKLEVHAVGPKALDNRGPDISRAVDQVAIRSIVDCFDEIGRCTKLD